MDGPRRGTSIVRSQACRNIDQRDGGWRTRDKTKISLQKTVPETSSVFTNRENRCPPSSTRRWRLGGTEGREERIGCGSETKVSRRYRVDEECGRATEGVGHEGSKDAPVSER